MQPWKWPSQFTSHTRDIPYLCDFMKLLCLAHKLQMEVGGDIIEI